MSSFRRTSFVEVWGRVSDKKACRMPLAESLLQLVLYCNPRLSGFYSFSGSSPWQSPWASLNIWKVQIKLSLYLHYTCASGTNCSLEKGLRDRTTPHYRLSVHQQLSNACVWESAVNHETSWTRLARTIAQTSTTSMVNTYPRCVLTDDKHWSTLYFIYR